MSGLWKIACYLCSVYWLSTRVATEETNISFKCFSKLAFARKKHKEDQNHLVCHHSALEVVAGGTRVLTQLVDPVSPQPPDLVRGCSDIGVMATGLTFSGEASRVAKRDAQVLEETLTLSARRT